MRALLPRPFAGRVRLRPVARARPAARATRTRRARAAVLLLPVWFPVVLAAAWVGTETVRPEVVDPDYHLRRDALRARVAENPGRPVAVVIGSSRMSLGFAPETLPEPARPAVWFNSSHFGAGPVMNGIILTRLLADGVRPDLAVFEVMPVFYVSENTQFLVRHLTYRDVARAHRYALPGEIPLCYLRDRLTRPRHLARAADPFDRVPAPLPFGGPPVQIDDVTPDDRAARIAVQYDALGPAARGMAVRPAADRALRDTMGVCRDRGVTAVLVLSPEGPTFRGFYDPAGLARFEEYVAGVAREYGVRLIDARGWLTEADFMDSHHPLRRGAAAFTARLVDAIGFRGR